MSCSAEWGNLLLMELLKSAISKPRPTLRLHAKPLLQRISVLSINFHAWEVVLHISSSFSTPENNKGQKKELDALWVHPRWWKPQPHSSNRTRLTCTPDRNDEQTCTSSLITSLFNVAKNGWQLEGEVLSQSNHRAVERSDPYSPNTANYKKHKALKFQLAAFWQRL